MSERYLDALLAGAKAIGIALDPDAAAAMARHFALVLKWNKRINLTRILDPERAAYLHGLDSLLFAERLPADRELDVVDVGSGAGFPGIVVALVRPRLRITLLEPIRKKASFLRTAAAELGLERVRVIEGKLAEAGVEDEGPPWPTDVILSRATLPPPELVPRAAPRLRVGGRLVMSSGRVALEPAELQGLAHSVGLVHEDRTTRLLPGSEQRVIDTLERVDRGR